MSIPTRKIEAQIIDVHAHAVDGRQHINAARFNNDPHTVSQDNAQEFAQPYSGSSSLGGLGRSAHDTYNDFADQTDCYPDTVIFFHHSKKGVRFALQANTRNALIIAFILIMLVSRPGVVELLFNMVKGVANIH
jgi:hypothetical protein